MICLHDVPAELLERAKHAKLETFPARFEI